MTIIATILSLLHCDGPVSQPVDISARLDGLAAARPDHPDWRHSVVDLMKLLDIDSSADNRNRLAFELDYPGDMAAGRGAMNEWLRKEVMRRVSDNGGKVPEELM